VAAVGAVPERVVLSDGRDLAYASYGDPGGRPAFYFHGFPGSRIEARLIDADARRHCVRLLALDRPGYGGSDFQDRRTIPDWPGDVSAVADALGIDRFSVIGASGGAPYALACARTIPERLEAAVVLCGLGPLDDPGLTKGMMVHNRIGLLAARRTPWLALPLFTLLTPAFRRLPSAFVARLASHVSQPDREFLAHVEHSETFAATFREAFRRGARGPALDGRLYGRPWGFALEEIEMTVHLWHGECDNIVPPAMGRYVAAALPDCRATFCPDDGHFTVAIDRARDVLAAVLGSLPLDTGGSGQHHAAIPENRRPRP
jgi:pimeloyl-ACP methyl ester carboxylesterase